MTSNLRNYQVRLTTLASSLYERYGKNINWKGVGKYAGLGALGAATGWTAGHLFGKDIADLIGVESKFMGMERTIAAEQIRNLATILGGLLGMMTAFYLDKKSRK